VVQVMPCHLGDAMRSFWCFRQSIRHHSILAARRLLHRNDPTAAEAAAMPVVEASAAALVKFKDLPT
jgi:hypothetical protein